MMRVETGSGNDVQEVSEMQEFSPFFLAPIIDPWIPGRIAMRRVRVLGPRSWLLTRLIRKYIPVQKGGAQLRCSSIGARQEFQ